jgi:hypothetical protein
LDLGKATNGFHLCESLQATFDCSSLPRSGWAAQRQWLPMQIMARISRSAGAPLVIWLTAVRQRPAPPFATIATRSDFTPEKVAFFLLDPHPKMPNFPLSRSEAADIAAYIGSLRK